jgi:hypothetical protein
MVLFYYTLFFFCVLFIFEKNMNMSLIIRGTIDSG